MVHLLLLLLPPPLLLLVKFDAVETVDDRLCSDEALPSIDTESNKYLASWNGARTIFQASCFVCVYFFWGVCVFVCANLICIVQCVNCEHIRKI